MEIGIRVAGESQRNEIAPGDVDAKLLAEFADRCVLGVLAPLNLAAGKLPQTGKGLPRRASRQQNQACRIDQRASRDHDHGA